MKVYVPFAYEMYGRIEVEADSMEEAFSNAEEQLRNISVTQMSCLCSYLSDSEEIDVEGVILDTEGNPVFDK